MAAPTSRPTAKIEKRGTSIAVTIFGGIVAVLVIWYFLPGVFDSSSESVFASKNRRSPLVEVAGPQTVIDKSATVKEDEYLGLGFKVTVPSTVTVHVTQSQGPQFDLYVLDRSGYVEFDAAAGKLFGGTFHHFPALSGRVSTSLRRSGNLAPGDYYVLLDNSDFGDASPPMNFTDDKVVVNIKVIAE